MRGSSALREVWPSTGRCSNSGCRYQAAGFRELAGSALGVAVKRISGEPSVRNGMPGGRASLFEPADCLVYARLRQMIMPILVKTTIEGSRGLMR